MNVSLLKSQWKTIAVALIAAVVLTILFCTSFPWLALLSAFALLFGGIAYAAWPAISEKLASLRSVPSPSLQRRIYMVVPIVLYGVVLLALSQSQIRANWRAARISGEVAREIVNANAALEKLQIDEAITICNVVEPKANADQKTQLDAIRARVQSIQKANRTNTANASVRQLLSEGRNHVFWLDLDNAQSTLLLALNMPMATDFGPATELANAIVDARTKLARGFLETGKLDNAKDQALQAINVPSSTELTEAKRIITEISNREVAELVASARESLEKMDRDQAAASLEKAIAIPYANETTEAEKIFSGIREARETEANARVSTLITDSQRSIDTKEFDQAIRILNTALGIPNSTLKAEVAAKIRVAQEHLADEKKRTLALAKANEERMAAAEAARKAEEEFEQNGLVLLRKTVEGKAGKYGAEITGIVVNRRNKKLSYAQITFNLYDDSGAQVGSALANINGLEPGGSWKFKASSLGTEFSKYKIDELTGF